MKFLTDSRSPNFMHLKKTYDPYSWYGYLLALKAMKISFLLIP